MASSSLTAKIIFSMVRRWVKENRLEAILIVLILVVGAFLRLYRISDYMTFLGDEGRDAIVVRRLLVDFDPILIGPRTSIGDMYLGPLYYYLMAPALLFANFSPVGPAVMIALLGVATIFFVWWITREWFYKKSTESEKVALGALIAAGLYSISPVVIIYSRSSWNPNIMPFFALLSVYSIWNVWRKQKFGWLIVTGIAMAFVLQSHYLGLLLAPTLGFFWLLTFVELKMSKVPEEEQVHYGASKSRRPHVKGFIKHSIIGAGIFTLLMSPLVIFDARHGWRNFAAMKKFFTVRQTTVSARPWTAIPELPEITNEMVTRVVAGTNEVIGMQLGYVFLVILSALFVLMIYIIVTKRRLSFTNGQAAYLFLLVWIGVGLVGLGVYKQEIYDHYYGFFFAAPFILMGGFTKDFVGMAKKYGSSAKIIGYLLVGAGWLILISTNLKENPLRYPPNRQLQRTMAVSEKIIEEADGEEFNLAVLAERNYEGAYQYFLEKQGAPIVMIDPQRAEDTVSEQLFVVCELLREECDPVNNPKAEIANFGWSKIEKVWRVEGITLYKLVPNF